MAVNDISWNLNQPVSKARMLETKNKKGDKLTVTYAPISKELLESQMPHLKKGDKIVVLYNRGQVVYAEPIMGTRVNSLLQALDRGLDKTVPQELSSDIYTQIGFFNKPQTRQELANKFEKHKLTFRELLGDHSRFEGGLHKKEGIWHYNLGS